jgi:serine/threonine-protein kinase
MSPEQLNGSTIDGRADVWSIGAILYGMLTGRPPYDFANVAQTFMAIATGAPPPAPTSLDASIPPAVEAVILRCLAHDRDARIGSVAELAGELLRAVDSPHASEVQAQLAAVLQPSVPPSLRSGPLSSTTGSHVAFALGNTGSYPALPAAPMPTTLPAPEPRSAHAKRWMLGAGMAAVFALVTAVGMGAGRPSVAAGGAASQSEKSAMPKRLLPEKASRLVMARVAEAEPARAQAWHPAPARPSTKEPTTSPEPAPAAAPRPPPPAKSAAPVNPLEDRQ